MPKLIQKNMQAAKIYSLYESTKKRFIDEFQRIRTKYQLKNLVLVVDLPSAKILSGMFTVTELVEYSVVFIERLQVIRKPLDHHAIYFITPNQQSITSMLKDFEQQDNPHYRKAHVLFTGSLEEGLIRKISQSKHFLKRLARHSFKEFYCQLQIISDNCAHFNIPYLQHAFSAENPREKELRVQIAKRIVHLVAAYPSLHTVRFLYDKDTPNKVAERVVERSAKEVNNYLTKLLESKSQAIDANATDVTIFVVDRSIDVITPTIHGYAYQSLLYDLLNQAGKQSEQYAKLPRQIFNEFRYRHISHALKELPQRLDEVLQKINKGTKLDPMEVKSMVEQKQKLNIHVELLHRLFQKYKEKNLNEIGELQLCLATGVTEDGQQTSSSELIGKVLLEIKNNKVLNVKELVRLAMLVLICVKVSKEDYQTLLSLFPEQYKTVLTNLVVLGISYDKKVTKSTKNIEKSAMDRARQLLAERSIPSERFESALQITLPRLITILNKNKTEERRKIGEIAVSVSSQAGLQPRFDQQRLICFMCGGLSPTQICNIRRDHSLDAVVLAADKILTPQDFLDALGKIDILGK